MVCYINRNFSQDFRKYNMFLHLNIKILSKHIKTLNFSSYKSNVKQKTLPF